MSEYNTLIVYASRYGAVEKCAREIFELLDGRVDICNLDNRELFPDISTYDSVIIGGSIYYGKVQKNISKFCLENIDTLQNKRLGFFIGCGYSGEKAEKELREAFPQELYDKAQASDYFGGEIDKSKLSFLEKIIIKQVEKTGELTDVTISQEKIKKFVEKMKSPDAPQE